MDYVEFGRKVGMWLEDNVRREIDVEKRKDAENALAYPEPRRSDPDGVSESGRVSARGGRRAGRRNRPEEDPVSGYSVSFGGSGYLTSTDFDLRILYLTYTSRGWPEVEELMRKALRDTGFLRRGARTRSTKEYMEVLEEGDRALFEKLRRLRMEKAKESGVAPYVIFSNRAIYEMCQKKPVTLRQMQEINGVGEKNSHQYGKDFLKVIRAAG